MPQLAIDLFSYRCYTERPSIWRKIGFLESDHVHPVAGVEEKPSFTSTSETAGHELSLSLEGKRVSSCSHTDLKK